MTRALQVPKARSSASAEPPAIALRRILWACSCTPCSTRALQPVIPLARAYGWHAAVQWRYRDGS